MFGMASGNGVPLSKVTANNGASSKSKGAAVKPLKPVSNVHKSNLPSQELLDDLCSRFVLNVPVEELQSFERILFLIEQAHWFYEDNSREQFSGLKSLNLRDFTSLMFQKCAALRPYLQHVDDIYKDFTTYKTGVPVTGAIILSEDLQKCLLVKGWKAGSSWGFPRGKKNKDEEDHLCAIREVQEETGLDIAPYLRPEDSIELTIGRQRSRLFIIPSLSERTPLEPRTKKEISEIGWHFVEDVPAPKDGSIMVHSRGPKGASYFMVYPYIPLLKEWIAKHRFLHGLPAPLPAIASPGTIYSVWKTKSGPAVSNQSSSSTATDAAFGAAALSASSPALADMSQALRSASAPAAASHQTRAASSPAPSADAPSCSLRDFHFDMERILRSLEFPPP
eukprot:jgi/Mesen1/8992/ME000056S08401